MRSVRNSLNRIMGVPLSLSRHKGLIWASLPEVRTGADFCPAVHAPAQRQGRVSLLTSIHSVVAFYNRHAVPGNVKLVR